MRWSGQLQLTDVRQLDKGGHGQVFAAKLSSRDGISQEVVLKLAHGGTPDEVLQSKQFLLEEARLTARFNHPNIVRFVDYNDVEHDGELVPCLILEHGGVALSALMRSHGGRLDPGLAAFIGVAVLAGLAHAHERGVVHRDVKPGNVLVGAHGQIKLIDFGIAKAADSRNPTTVVNALKGTPVYISPEAYQGEKLDGRADLWAVGVMLYEMLVGRHPWQVDRSDKNQMAYVRQISDLVLSAPTPPLPPELVPGDLADVVEKLLMKARNDRYEDAFSAMYALERVAVRLVGPWAAARELGQQTHAAEEPLARRRVPAPDAPTVNVRSDRNEEEYVYLAVGPYVDGAGVDVEVPPELAEEATSGAFAAQRDEVSALHRNDLEVTAQMPLPVRASRQWVAGVAVAGLLLAVTGGVLWGSRSESAAAGVEARRPQRVQAGVGKAEHEIEPRPAAGEISRGALADRRALPRDDPSGGGEPVRHDPAAGVADAQTQAIPAVKTASEAPIAEPAERAEKAGVGALEVILLPRGAFVSIDGQPPVKAPFTFEKLRQGSHTARVGLEANALDRVEKVRVRAGATSHLRIELANPFADGE